MEYEINRTRQLASSIIQNKIEEIGRIKREVSEINLNADEKRFWMIHSLTLMIRKETEVFR